MPGYKVLLRTTKYYEVLQNTTSITKHYYSVLESTTKYYCVLSRTTNYCPVLICLMVATHETSFTLGRATYGMQSTMELRHSCLIVTTHETLCTLRGASCWLRLGRSQSSHMRLALASQLYCLRAAMLFGERLYLRYPLCFWGKIFGCCRCRLFLPLRESFSLYAVNWRTGSFRRLAVELVDGTGDDLPVFINPLLVENPVFGVQLL